MYNDCFVLSAVVKTAKGKNLKQCICIDSSGKAQRLNKIDKTLLHYYGQSYEAVQKSFDDYLNGKPESGSDRLRVSLWLENAKWDNLSLFVIDFDEANKDGKFFKAAHTLADKVTRSQGGGYHMFYGVDRAVAEPLFDKIHLTTAKGTKSFVCEVAAHSNDGDKVDFFCENGRLIHEHETWDNTAGVTDTTMELYELISRNFTFREKASNDLKDADGRDMTLVALSESDMFEQMNERQRLVFEDLKMISADCSQREWFSIGCDISAVFPYDDDNDTDLGGSVFLWWSKQGESFQPQGCANTWCTICNKERRLCNTKWSQILEVNAFDVPLPQMDIVTQIAALPKRPREYSAEAQAELERLAKGLFPIEAEDEEDRQIMFRGKPIRWNALQTVTTVPNAIGDDEQELEEGTPFIEYDGKQYTFHKLLKAYFGSKYQAYNVKVRYNTDNIFRIGNNQRRRLSFCLLENNREFPLVEISEQDEIDIIRLIKAAPHNKAVAEASIVGYNNGTNGVARLVTFGNMRTDGNITDVWCYRCELGSTESRYKGENRTWEEWADGLRLAIHSNYLEDEAKEDNIYMRLSYQDGAYLALPSKYGTAINLWITQEQRGAGAEFPFTGAINKAYYEFTITPVDYEIVPIGKGSLREPQEMAEYNRTVKSEEQAAVKFASFPDGEYTIKELETFGFNHHNVDSYYKNDWLTRRKKGRAYVYSKKFV